MGPLALPSPSCNCNVNLYTKLYKMGGNKGTILTRVNTLVYVIHCYCFGILIHKTQIAALPDLLLFFSGAISILNKGLAVDPYNVHVLLDLGLSYDNIGNHSTASIYFNKVIKLSDSNPQYATQRGVALESLGQHLAAIPYFNQALKINPRDVFALMVWVLHSSH